MKNWSQYAFNTIERHIRSQISKRGQSAENCRANLWNAGLEALSSYSRVSGCCDLDSYVEYNMDQCMELLRKERNERLSLESTLSLDAPYLDSRESFVERLRGRVGDCSNFVALWDFAARLGPRKNRVLHQMDHGMEPQEIMDANHMTLEEYQALLTELQSDFLFWLSI